MAAPSEFVRVHVQFQALLKSLTEECIVLQVAPELSMFDGGERGCAVLCRDALVAAGGAASEDALARAQQLATAVLPLALLGVAGPATPLPSHDLSVLPTQVSQPSRTDTLVQVMATIA